MGRLVFEEEGVMYKQVFDPVGDSLGLSAIFAALPLVVLFVLMGGLKVKAHWAGLCALGTALVVAVAVYGVPVGQAADSALLGAAFGIFPIMWIVVNAIWIFKMTEASGHFEVLRRSFGSISDDQRIQAIIIAFSFGALLEALAGFGTPVAITATMLIGFGFKPIKAASVGLVANTAPVAFGAIAIPIITLAEVTGLPKDDLGALVGRQTPFLALFVPLILVFMVDGTRGIRQTWPAAIVGGGAFAIGQFATSNYVSVELADIVAALLSVVALVAFLRVWKPSETVVGEAERGPGMGRPAMAGGQTADSSWERDVRARREGSGGDSPRAVLAAYAPYIIIIIVFGLAQWGPIKTWLEGTIQEFNWPGLDIVKPDGTAPSSQTFKLNYLPAAGTLLLLSGLLTMLVLRIPPRIAVSSYAQSLNQLKWATLTVASVLALAYVMNLSGQSVTLGQWAAGAGGIYAFVAPIVGWFGVALTGSDTSSNALFGALQVKAAQTADLDPLLMATANTSGGVMGKMISPQNLAIGAAAVGLAGQEGVLFRKVIGWSFALLLLMCVLITLQSTVLDWMVP
jgi:lactate permease